MKQKKKSLVYFLFLPLLFIITSCSHSPLDDLNKHEKELAEKIIADLKKNQSTDPSLADNLSSYGKYLQYSSTISHFEPIPDVTAQNLITNYDGIEKVIDFNYKGQMRPFPVASNTRKDLFSRNIWIPIDQFRSLYSNLVNYEQTYNKITGFNIYMAAYPYDKAGDAATFPGSVVRINGDTLSGRVTLVFVGTADTTTLTDYNVLRQKELTNYSTAPGIMSTNGYYNHGTMCPDSCSAP